MADNDDMIVTVTEIEALEHRLASLDLSDRERTVLSGVFALAGRAAADLGDDVSGFMPTAVEYNMSINFTRLSGLPSYLGDGSVKPGGQFGGQGTHSSFSWGMGAHGSGGGGGAG